MKKLWNKLTAPLPRLSRKGKVVRNLAVTLLIFAALPFLLGLPVLTADGAFRQAERQFLLAPSEQVLKSGNGYLSQGEDWVAAGQVRRHSSMGPYQKYQGIINNVLPRDELGVVFIPGEENGIYTAAVFGLPEEAVSGVLELTISGVTATLGGRGHPAEETFTVETDGKNPQHLGILQNFTNAILGTEPLFVQGTEGLKGVQIMDGMLLSSFLGKAVELPFDDDLYLSELQKRQATGREKRGCDKILDTAGSYGSKETK